jgi:hypothetical protein
MIINNSNTIKLSKNGRVKIIKDFFPHLENKINNNIITTPNISIHARAFCLYCALLVTKVYENSTDDIELEDNDRELEIQQYIRLNPKHSQLTEDQITSKAHEMIVKDIRNCFAHGNFGINYDDSNNQLYFVLSPQRKGLNINTPIIISANSIQDSIIKFGLDYLMSDNNNFEFNTTDNLSNLLKMILIPSQMLKIGDYYSNENSESLFLIDPKRHILIQHIMLVAQITYEQDDYYNIFGKDSIVFEKISLIRNSIAHNCYLFANLTKSIHYIDRNRELIESLNSNVVYLDTINELKNSIMSISNKNHSSHSINELKSRLTEFLNLYFDNLNKIINLDSENFSSNSD